MSSASLLLAETAAATGHAHVCGSATRCLPNQNQPLVVDCAAGWLTGLCLITHATGQKL